MFSGCTVDQRDEIARLGEIVGVGEGSDVVRQATPATPCT